MKKIVSGALIAAAAVTTVSACQVDTKHEYSTTSTGTSTSSVNNTAGKHVKKPRYTVAQQQAIQSAQSYLDMEGFSRAGLIGQLTSNAGEGFRHADAVFAVNHIKVNWNEQAARSAKEYLSMTHFSRNGLITQLSSSAGSKFTHAQAVYGVNHAGL